MKISNLKFQISNIVLIALCALICSSCEKKDAAAEERPLTLTLSTDSVYCLPVYKDLPALEMAWTAGSNHGTGSAISYILEMDKEGNNFAGGLQWKIGRTADRTMVFGHKQLADTLALAFPADPEDAYQTFEWRIRAKVMQTGEEQVSPVVKVKIAWNVSMLTALYLVGDATPNGWSLDRATPMVIDMTHFSRFYWTGKLNKGEFKLLITDSTWLPCYVSDLTDATKMVYRPTDASYTDNKWLIDKGGNYRIEADVKALTISVTYLGGEMYSHMYMIGDATPGGWSWDNITEMQHPETNIFTWEGNLSAGQIKFPTELKSDWSGEMLYAPTPDCAPTTNGTFEARAGGADNKWLISNPGEYQIRININDTTISFVKL
jgi:hypothetical protein